MTLDNQFTWYLFIWLCRLLYQNWCTLLNLLHSDLSFYLLLVPIIILINYIVLIRRKPLFLSKVIDIRPWHLKNTQLVVLISVILEQIRNISFPFIFKIKLEISFLINLENENQTKPVILNWQLIP